MPRPVPVVTPSWAAGADGAASSTDRSERGVPQRFGAALTAVLILAVLLLVACVVVGALMVGGVIDTTASEHVAAAAGHAAPGTTHLTW
ncbi:MAG: hypothetical protein LBK95_21455 [Bifidobacteriaceae bacterium]|nr:hypothetical protein [Bifidobacteriaceae bacterium]